MPNHNVTIKHIRAFRAVSEHSHFTRAAQALGLSQPALSALIAQLEQELSARLFTRDRRGAELTLAGREFLIASSRVLSEMDAAVGAARDYGKLRRGRLRIAALPSLCTLLLPNIIRRFHDQHKFVVIQVLDLVGEEVIGRAKRREIDFGLGYVGPGDAVDHEPILADQLVAVASRSRLGSVAETVAWKELADHEIIAMGHGTTIRRLTDDAIRRSHADLRILLEPLQMPTAIAYARAGLGVAILPSTGVPRNLEADMVSAVLTDPIVDRTVSIIRSSEAQLEPAAEAFLAMVREEASHWGHPP